MAGVIGWIERCCCMLSFAAMFFLLPNGVALAFGFDDVAAKAKSLAATPYSSPTRNISKGFATLTYDQYRDIRFDPTKAYWRSEIANNKVQEIRFDPRTFNYGANEINPKELAGLGFAGFRVHYPINTQKYKDEVIVFLGASYFRAVGKNQLYGLSGRGLAIDTAMNSGEEFPQFVEFWVERPDPAAKELTIYALLNSRRVTGAYRFVVKPGSETVIDIKMQLHLRENIGKLGVAPLTGMFFFGENQRSLAEDYRPEVHDTDGLSVQSGTGEWIWRPLINPKRLLVTSFALNNPAGFGLMQRDRKFTNFEDLEAHYELRPSVWIEPKGQWGPGRVELIQIPTPDETNDNIVAFWVPDAPARAGMVLDFEYRLLCQMETERRPPLSWATQTRKGHGWLRKPDDSIALSVDFEGPALKKLGANTPVEAIVSADNNGKLMEVNSIRNEITGGWRMTVRLRRLDEKKPVELRGFLHSNNNTLSETWSYILPPD
jgi:glucans biosynthesis protein